MFRVRRPAARLGLCLGALTLAACSSAAGAGSDPTSASPPVTSASSAHPAPRPVTPTPAAHRVVLGLGDSVTTGLNCGCTDFVTAYAARLPASQGGPAQADNQGVNGQTAAQLAAALDAGGLRADLARATTVIVTIGANDLTPLVSRWSAGRCDTACGTAAATAVGRAVGHVLDAIGDEGAPGGMVLVTGYWNVFEDGDVGRQRHGDAFGDWSDRVTRALNTTIAGQAAAHQDTYVDLYTPFEGSGDKDPTGLLGADGDHPNAAGEALITRVLLAATP